MKLKSYYLFVPASCLVALTLIGCSKAGGSAPTALEPAKIPATVNQAFTKSSEQTKEAAAGYVAAMQSQDPASAFVQLRKLSAQGDLTPEQRLVVAKSMPTTFQQLQAAANSGNASANTVMHQYLSSR